jgi:hypothetical protein
MSLKHSKLKLRSLIMSLYLLLKLLVGIILKNIKLTLGSLLNLINTTLLKTQSFIFKLMLNSLAIKIKFNGHRLYTSLFKRMTKSHIQPTPITFRKFKDIKLILIFDTLSNQLSTVITKCFCTSKTQEL